jgi:hypothetical protein
MRSLHHQIVACSALVLLGTVAAQKPSKTAVTQSANTARLYVNEPVAYDADLPCYQCIMNNYIYCVEGAERQIVAKGKNAPKGYCCSSYESCSYVKNPAYSCSSTYTDQLMSLRVCPFKVDSCGKEDTYKFEKTGSS